jgi:DNA primase
MTSSPIFDARDRHSLAEVARRTGIPVATSVGAVTVRCPMPSHGHPDRTPSMRLYLDDGRYYCFGCGARGDVVQWVSDAERANVVEAIRLLDSGAPFSNTWAGAAAGPRPPNTEPATQTARARELPDLDRTPPDRVRAALRAAWGYYTSQPLHSQGAEYLAKRGIDVAVLEAHTGRAEVGCTPATHNGLVTALRARGFTNDDLVDAGMAHRPLGVDSVSDYYRQRVLIPLRDPSAELCGIVGRNVGDVRWPKYKNPPRTHVYDKSVNFYQPLPIPAFATVESSSSKERSTRWPLPLRRSDAECRMASAL